MVYRNAELTLPHAYRHYANLVNITASLLFVFGLSMKVEGVALGTLIAQYAGLTIAFLLWLRYYQPLRKYIQHAHVFERNAMSRFFQVNRDIFSAPSVWLQ